MTTKAAPVRRPNTISNTSAIGDALISGPNQPWFFKNGAEAQKP